MMKLKMVKRIVCLAAAVLLSAQTAVFAFDDGRTITAVAGYTANLYLSDWTDGSIVLKNVKPVVESPQNLVMAAELEYTKVPAFEGNMYSKDGKELDFTSLSWYLDMNVNIVAAHLADGSYRIICVAVR